MARYIDAEALKELRHNYIQGQIKFDGSEYDLIDKCPTADVVAVKHGEWIEDGYAEKPCVCSYCGEEAQYISRFEETFDYDWEENLQSTGYEEIREYIRTPYCPNCGARMDGRSGE